MEQVSANRSPGDGAIDGTMPDADFSGGVKSSASGKAPAQGGISLADFRWPDLLFIAGLLAVAVPTMIFVARSTWTGEQGAHGPIVLMTGLWLLWREWPAVRHLSQAPAFWKVIALIIPALIAYALARITQIIELEGYIMYGVLVIACYAVVGAKPLIKLAFPIIYLAFIFPPPDTVIYTFTLPIKVAISETAIWLLQLFGYPIGGTGVTIQIGQYQLLVAAACAGLNSIVSLSALTIFYIYIRHMGDRRYQLTLLLFVLPVAIAANFVRVLILILLTYHAGEAAAQSFLHDMAGLTMFAMALLMIFLVDMALARFFGSKEAEGDAPLSDRPASDPAMEGAKNG
ncbi:exosortase V [Qipengyuania sp. DGS5-3]|uniref:exosortase V n=1 Tax=Qipengyuania sp. DGS5-3 TaxID=3349632 RepID=UPI0036D2A7EF